MIFHVLYNGRMNRRQFIMAALQPQKHTFFNKSICLETITLAIFGHSDWSKSAGSYVMGRIMDEIDKHLGHKYY